jgi:D-beta-D-heptose 7-phosphate kinase/D-beta-D-heptose 1-phosphate adenosyltransferase
MSAVTGLLAAFAGRELLVVGDALLDLHLAGAAGRLCREGPMPVVDVAQRAIVPGG